MQPLISLFALYSWAITLPFVPPTQTEMKTITQNGMTVQWEFQEDRLLIELNAPTQGWVAIGFNETNQLAETYLIMASVEGNEGRVLEHWVLAPGDYRPVNMLGGPEVVEFIRGEEQESGTTICFSIPVEAQDSFRKDLRPDAPFYLLLAYSRKDDFAHHSLMRTSIFTHL
ncbi:MAG: DOMON domain-containing protein [Bacteroidota bacterium]